jgi:hypothetical protein
MQHFLSHTIHTFGASCLPMWQSVIPAIAYGSRTVNLGMLTAGALCIHNHVDPLLSLHYLQIAEFFGQQFVDESTQQLREMRPGDVDSNLACSRLLDLLSVAFFRVHQRNGVTILEPAAWTWLHMVRGSRSMHSHYANAGGLYNAKLANMPNIAVSTHAPSPSSENQWFTEDFFSEHPLHHLINSTRDERCAALYRAVSERRHMMSDEDAEALMAAVKLLEDTCSSPRCRDVHDLTQFIFTWPCLIPQRVVAMLCSGNLLALCIHAHWLMLTVMCENCWYVDNMGRYGISEVTALVDADPTLDVEQGLMKWPRQLLDTWMTP